MKGFANLGRAITSCLAFLSVASALSQTLDPFGPGVDNASALPNVLALALQPGNKVLVGGDITSLGGMPASGLGRLNFDGSRDTTLQASSDNTVQCFGIMEDRRILAGGFCAVADGTALISLRRYSADGTLDAAFNPNPQPNYSNPVDCTVNTLLPQRDDRVVLGGIFTLIDGMPGRHLVRLMPDGSLDGSFFAPVNGFLPTFPPYDQTVYSMAQQPDGAIVLGGSFKLVGGSAITNIARIGADGGFDDSFISGAFGAVYSVVIQPDGKIIAAGVFTNLSGQNCINLGRLFPDGSLDTSFHPSVTGGVYTVALQSDGKILIGGGFTKINGQTRTYLGRLNSDGTLDYSFDAHASNVVNALLLQPDGKILVGGSFTGIAGQPQKALARLNNTDPAIQDLSFDDSSVTWLRSGTSPEIWRASFDFSPNGVDWINLGDAVRISGGWQLTGLSLSSGVFVRARGFLTGGRYNGSASILETVVGPPIITAQPVSQTNNAATPAAFRVVAGGTPPLNYQWLKNGTNLIDGSNLSGAQTSVLSLSNVFGTDRGGYSVAVTNSFGSVTSLLATLTVIDPLITNQPVSQWHEPGQTAQLTVGAIGTAPLRNQWRKNGTNLIGATTSTLTLSNLQKMDIGQYDVLVSNSFGTVTSSVAWIGVNFTTLDSFAPQGDVGIESMVLQADGRIIMTGWRNGAYGATAPYLVRLKTDGTPDPTFSVTANGSAPYFLTALLAQPDGKLLIGGGFSAIDGQVRTNLARLNADGSLDTNFVLGVNNAVDCLALQPDGSALAGGYFSAVYGGTRWFLERLGSNGVPDLFKPVPDTTVHTVAIQPDGKVIAGGEFLNLNYRYPHPYIGRINPDGSIDDSFTIGADYTVHALAIQPDGKVLVGGAFSHLGGQPRSYLGRLNPDGTLDDAFNPGADLYVYTFALQTDGKILVGGPFSTLGGLPAKGLGRLNPDGTRDLTFNPTVSGYVGMNCLTLQPDGKILVGANGTNSVFRLNNTDPATQSLVANGSTITWLRGGSSPEVWRTTFESSSDGVNWRMLGAGTRIPGGWQMSASGLAGSVIRARGWVTSGYFNGSTWFVETNLALAPVVVRDASFGMRSNGFGFNARANSGQVVVIEASTNLTNWVAIQTNLVTASGMFYFTDPDSRKFSRRFYRARLFNGTLPPPSVVGTRSAGSQSFGFNLNAVPGQTIVIEASTNLKTWTPLSTNSLTNGALYFTDPASPNLPWRFYRARL